MQEEGTHPVAALEDGLPEGFPLRAWWHLLEELQVAGEELCSIVALEPRGRRDCRRSGWLILGGRRSGWLILRGRRSGWLILGGLGGGFVGWASLR